MTVTYLAPFTRQQFFAPNGQFLSYGTVFTYEAGSTTPAATYTDSTGATQNSNPIQLDAYGSASIWLPPNVAFKFSVFDQQGNQLPGYPVDQIILQQEQFYAGVDTGSVNAYILNFNAGFSSLTDGIVLYWIPANSNTGPSTLNVNGLGNVPIVNQTGLPLTANQLINGQVAVVLYNSGQWLLIQGANQGIVSYGGADNGTANAYVVPLTGESFSYTAGNVLFFIPSNTNTGASTINVKGLGTKNILNVNGGALIGGELMAGQLTQIVYLGPSFQIVSPISWSGSFVVTSISGGTGGGTTTIYWTRYANCVSLQIPSISVTSTGTNFALNGFPTYLQGVTTQVNSPLFAAEDNSATGVAAYFVIPNQAGGSTISIIINNVSGNWTNSGTKNIAAANFNYIAR